MFLGSILVLAQLGAALEIETGSPDALCPDLTQTRDAVASRLGTLEVARGGWVAHYAIGHSPDATTGDFVRLSLRDPAGNVRLERDLPLEPGSCATMAQAIAVVLDRYFRSLAQEPSTVATSPEGDAPPRGSEPEESRDAADATVGVEGEPAPGVDSPSAARSPATLARAERESAHLWFGLSAGSLTDAESPAAEVVLAVELGRHAWLGFSGALPVRDRDEAVGDEWVSLRSVPLHVWLGLGPTRERWWLHAGPALLLAIERGSGAGLEDEARATRAVPGIGLTFGAGLRLRPWFGLGLRAAVDASSPEMTRVFFVTGEGGAEREVLVPPVARGALFAGVFFRF